MVLGLVAPIVVIVGLRVWNVWVALDVIAGAALAALLLAGCAAVRLRGGGDVFVD